MNQFRTLQRLLEGMPNIDRAGVNVSETLPSNKSKSRPGTKNELQCTDAGSTPSAVHNISDALATHPESTRPITKPPQGRLSSMPNNPVVGLSTESHQTRSISPRTPCLLKRKRDVYIDGGNSPSERSSKKVRQNERNTQDRRNVVLSPGSTSTLPKSRQKIRTPSRTPHSARSTRQKLCQDELQQGFTLASSKDTHIQEASSKVSTVNGLPSNLGHPKQTTRIQRPIRKVKLLQSIEHRIDPHNPKHSPYPWDDPLVSHWAPKRNNQDGKPNHMHILVVSLKQASLQVLLITLFTNLIRLLHHPAALQGLT